ncbi:MULTISPECIES: hypothetical protein [Halorussus]|uniref:hypothetical protein n=1 Tax=Halorussus TaxID=1070314 RepID=UPI00209D19EE|nr:hypothetical protein [Halorussus vallis]USZ74460.1 hypothetical protein NGM07_13515 [Halorussus vallis]
METTDFDPVACPAADCDYEDAVRDVAAHVSRAEDDGHSWDQLGYDGARDFVMTEKQRQMDGGSGGQAADGGTAGTAGSAGSGRSPAAAGDHPDGFGDEGDAEPFELGFEEDALVLLELVHDSEFETLDDLDRSDLVDLYTLLSDLKSAADDARKEVRDELNRQIPDDGTIPARLGSVRRYTYNRRSLKDEQTVRSELQRAGVDPDAVRTFDTSKLKQAAEDGHLDEEAVFDFEERTRLQKADANPEQRRRRFEGLSPDLRSLVEDDD